MENNNKKELMENVNTITSFAFIDSAFINIYNEENPILNIGDETYFLFSNVNDYHRLLIGKGKLIVDTFNDGMNKIYYIQLDEILENPDILKKFVYSKQFPLNKYVNEKLCYTKLIYITEKTPVSVLKHNLFKIECFFTRPTLEAITKLRTDFNQIMIKDIEKQLSDLREI